MFSRFASQTNGMVFTTGKDQFARRSVARYAAETLAAYLQGQERAYAVHDVLRELEALFHDGAAIPCRLLRDALRLPFDDEDQRAALVAKALDMIDRQARADAE